MNWTRLLLMSGLAGGCQPDTGAAGTAGATESGGSSATNESGTENVPSPMTGDGSAGSSAATTAEPSTSGNDTTTATGRGSESSSGGPPACPPETEVYWASEGTLEPPMVVFDSTILEREVVVSTFPEVGAVTLQLETICEGPIYLWALVFDAEAGNNAANADSYYVTIDGGEEFVWEYGCSTDGGGDLAWHWLPIEAQAEDCEHDPLGLMFAAGSHTIVIRNREADDAPDVTLLAAVVLSHDAEIDPSVFLDPAGPPP